MTELNQERLNSELKWLYDRFRDAHYNAFYYGEALSSERRKNRRFEIAVAFTTPGAIGGLVAFGGTQEVVALGVGASILAAVKPILNISDNIQRYTRLFNSYKEVAAELKLLVEKVRSDQDFTEEARLRLLSQAKRMGDLDALDDPKMDTIREKECYDRVNKMFPPSYFWHPLKEEVSQ